jgi:UDP-glucose 4-epimerase
MRWLVTGGCGFIGSRLVGRLRERGDVAIRVLDNLSVGRLQDLEAVTPCRVDSARPLAARDPGCPVQLVIGDLLDPDTLTAAMSSVDVVVHLAANTGVIPSIEDPLADCEANVVGTLRVLEAARAAGVRNFVFASSGAPLGDQTPPIHEKLLPNPLSPYGASKLAGETYCSVYHACFGLNTVSLRFGNVYGPGSLHKGSVVSKFIKEAFAGETLVVYGDGDQTRDFIYVDDVVEAMLLAGEFERGGELFQIATGAETTVNAIIDGLRELLDAEGITLAAECQPPRTGSARGCWAPDRRAAGSAWSGST